MKTIILTFLLFLSFSSTGKTTKQISIRVKYLNDDNFTYTDVSSAAKIWVATNAKAKNRKRLQFSEGTFRLDSLPSDCPYFQIKDQKGEMHTQKLCMGLKKDKEWIIYIGNKDCLYHFEGYQPEPFFPIYDTIYMTYNLLKESSGNEDLEENKKDSSFRNKLRELGLKRIQGNVYTLESKYKTEIFSELSKMEEVRELAPFRLIGKPESWMMEYFYSDIEILFLKELSDGDIDTLSKILGIDNIEKSELSYGSWKKYKSGFLYRIKLKSEAVIDYSFLEKLNKIHLENENVLVVKTSMSLNVTND